MVLDIDVAGARQVRKRYPDSVHVFVLPPSAPVLVQRLRNRNTEDHNGIGARMTIAARELEAVPEYDYVIVNDDFVEAVAHLAAILDVEERRVNRLNNLNQVVGEHPERARRPGHFQGVSMEIFTPTDAAKNAGTKYRSILVAARFARYLNDFPKDRQVQWAERERTTKLTTLSMRKLVSGELNFRELRRRRSEV